DVHIKEIDPCFEGLAAYDISAITQDADCCKNAYDRHDRHQCDERECVVQMPWPRSSQTRRASDCAVIGYAIVGVRCSKHRDCFSSLIAECNGYPSSFHHSQ